MTPITAAGEYHLTRRQILSDRARGWLTGTLAALALLGIYAGVQLYNDNIEQRAQIQAFNARGCPASWRGKPFAFSAEETLNLMRPGTTRIACYYKLAVKS
jgi:hypothetical protein